MFREDRRHPGRSREGGGTTPLDECHCPSLFQLAVPEILMTGLDNFQALSGGLTTHSSLQVMSWRASSLRRTDGWACR